MTQVTTAPAQAQVHTHAVLPNSGSNVLQLINGLSPIQIASNDVVKNKFIANYNAAHKEKIGEMVYHQQMVHFHQLVSASKELQAVDKFSLYACFVTAAVDGLNFDPNASEVYLLALNGKAFLWPQAGAIVKKLKRSGQVKYADQVRIVYQGDVFEVENGRVTKHIEKFESETMVAGYIRFVLDERGNDKFFIYRKSEWEAWKKKSKMQGGDNWVGNAGQPLAGFLRTKIVKHAAKDKSWATGNAPANVEQFNVFADPDEIDPALLPAPPANLPHPTMIVTPVDNGEVSHEAKAAMLQATADAPEMNGTVQFESDGGDEGF